MARRPPVASQQLHFRADSQGAREHQLRLVADQRRYRGTCLAYEPLDDSLLGLLELFMALTCLAPLVPGQLQVFTGGLEELDPSGKLVLDLLVMQTIARQFVLNLPIKPEALGTQA